MNAEDQKELERIEWNLANCCEIHEIEAQWLISQLKAAQEELTTAKALVASHETGDAMLLEMLPGHATIAEGITALKEENERLKAVQNQWQPIATAPKDGSAMLLCDMTAPKDSIHVGGWNYPAWYSRSNVWLTPTHWQPLPQLPKI